jgi:GH35 family endo-1,4-beta-xylanase
MKLRLFAFAAGLAALMAPAAADMTLKAAGASSGRYFGAALDPDLFDEKPYVQLAREQFSAVTPENAMKWAVVEPKRGVFDWSAADKLVAFAKANDQKIRGHNLVWYQPLPDWLTSGTFTPTELRQLMVDHVTLEAGATKAPSTPDDMREVMQKFADLGVDVAVTEPDVRMELPPDAKKLDAQAADYAKVNGACLAVKPCVGITTWGISDAHSWVPGFFHGYGAALLFDKDYKPKPAFFAAIDALTREAP